MAPPGQQKRQLGKFCDIQLLITFTLYLPSFLNHNTLFILTFLRVQMSCQTLPAGWVL